MTDTPRPTSSARAAAPWIFALAIALGFAAGARSFAARVLTPALPPASTSRVVVVPSPDVLRAVQSLARLETVSFHMERVVEVRDEQTHAFGLIDARDTLVLVASGDVVAGVDLSALGAGDVDLAWSDRRVTVTLPAPRVLHAALDSARTHVYRRDTDALARRDEGLETRARAEAERSMQAAAQESGVLDRARENGERTVRSLLGSMGFREVTVRWRDQALADH